MTIFLLLWTALIGADRINLLGAHSPFVLTPFLALTPAVVLIELRRRQRTGSRVVLPGGALPFIVLSLVLLCLCLASIYVSRDFRSSAPRAVQLALMMCSTFAVLLLTRDRQDIQAVLARGARWGLWVCIAFNVAGILVWLHILPEQIPRQFGAVRLVPDVYAGVVPRLAGMVMDSNRAGLLMLVFAFLIGRGEENRARAWRWMVVASVLILLTISRSSILAWLACIALVMINNRRATLPRGLIAFASILMALGAAGLLTVPTLRDRIVRGAEPLRGRLTFEEGSSQDHLRLLKRGFATGTQSIGTALHGIGYGSAHTVLQDFFPGSRYGNFHSVYVGVFAESGIFAFIALAFLIALPLLKRTEYAPLVGSLALFGMFYNALAEPVFWLVLVFGWIGLPEKSSRPKPMANATARPRIAPSSN